MAVYPKGHPVITWRCEQCTWFRSKHESAEWDNTVVDHKVYGPIKLKDLFILDVTRHDCKLTARRRKRYGIDPEVTYPERYEQRNG